MILHYRRQEPQAGREAGKKTAELRSERGVPGTANRQRNAALTGVGLAAAARVLRDSRFDQSVIAGFIVQAALVQIAREALCRGVRGLVARDNERLAELREELRRRHEAEGGQPTAS